MNSKYEKLPFLPETHLDPVCQGITLLRPLSRRGEGPGLIVLVPNTGVTGPSTLAIEEGIPCPLMKWGEEGYTTVEVTESAFETKSDPIKEAIASFAKHECANPKNVVGLIGRFHGLTLSNTRFDIGISIHAGTLESRCTASQGLSSNCRSHYIWGPL